VREPNTVRLHGMPGDIGIVSDVRIVEIGNALLVVVDNLIEGSRAVDARGVAICCRHGVAVYLRIGNPKLWLRARRIEMMGKSRRESGGAVESATAVPVVAVAMWRGFVVFLARRIHKIAVVVVIVRSRNTG